MSGYPMIDALNATHPLTPREKVARIVDPKAFDHPTVHPQHLVARRAVSFSKADAILTALASGSGDHAELARLAEAAGLLREWMGTWFVDADSRGESAIADDTRKFLSKEAERG